MNPKMPKIQIDMKQLRQSLTMAMAKDIIVRQAAIGDPSALAQVLISFAARLTLQAQEDSTNPDVKAFVVFAEHEALHVAEEMRAEYAKQLEAFNKAMAEEPEGDEQDPDDDYDLELGCHFPSNSALMDEFKAGHERHGQQEQLMKMILADRQVIIADEADPAPGGYEIAPPIASRTVDKYGEAPLLYMAKDGPATAVPAERWTSCVSCEMSPDQTCPECGGSGYIRVGGK